MLKKIISLLKPSWKVLSKHRKKDTKGVDGVSISDFANTADDRIKEIIKQLKAGTYSFSPLQPTVIPKSNGKTREILVGTVADRIVSKAILEVIKPRFQKYFSGSDYSIRNESADLQGIPAAIKRAQEKLAEDYVWVFETDIIDFFGKIPKDNVLRIIQSEIRDVKVRKLIEEIVRFEVNLDRSKKEEGYSDEDGVAQGSSISPLLAAIYLSSFDRDMQADPEIELIRYVDDLIILCKTENKAREIATTVENKLGDLGLTIHPLGSEKTRIIRAKRPNQETFTFLGLTFNYCDVDISKKKKDKIEEDFGTLLADTRLGFFEKRLALVRKVSGLIDQYNKPHYNTKDSLNSLTNTAERMIKAKFSEDMTQILGFNPFDRIKLNVTQTQKLSRFFGLDFKGSFEIM